MFARVRRLWERETLKKKILFICVPGILLVGVVVGILSFFVFAQYEKSMYQITVQNLDMMIHHVESELKYVDDASAAIVSDGVVQAAFLNEADDLNMEYIRALQGAYEVIQEHVAYGEHLRSIMVVSDEKMFFYGNRRNAYSKEELVDMAKGMPQNGSEIFWFFPEQNNGSVYGIRRLRRLSDYSSSDPVLVIMEYDLQSCLDEMLSDENQIQYAPSLIIRDKEKIIYSAMEGFVLPKSDVMDINPYTTIKFNNNEYFVSALDGPIYKWQFLFLVSEDELFSAVRSLKIVYIVLVVSLILLALYYSTALSDRMVRRFEHLTMRMKSVEQGNLNAVQPTRQSGSDELEMVCDRFEDMLLRINELIEENYVKQVLIRENQLKVLQNQINPHFLFNTLQTINWEAKESGQTVISNIAESLGKLLRYTLREDNEPALVSEECDILLYYMIIQRMRYQERLHLSLNVPDELQDKRIPKLSLQNLVENSIKYALENMLEPCYIKVWGEVNDNGFSIFAEDNGPGISDDICKKINNFMPDSEQGIAAGSDKNMAGNENGLKIGLMNLQARIKLLYSEKSGLYMTNTGSGTRAEIRIVRDMTEEQ